MIIDAYKFIIPLLASHVLVDFIFQSDHAAENKSRNSVLIWHALQIGISSYLLTGIITAWPVALIFLFSHLLIDAIKSRKGDGTTLKIFAWDQAAHILSLLLIGLTAHHLETLQDPGLWFRFFGMDYYRVLIIAAGLVASIRGGAITIRLELRSIELEPLEENKSETAESLPSGGMLIGYLERALIFLLVLVGEAGAIGFLIAAKSIFRFGETRSPGWKKAEYIIIGTLSSFLFGLAVAYTVRYIISNL